ncbi:MAG: alpha/beta hydrolase [Oligoflexia bacterium]|nr:alpha/beta hydrolase [Oligoflexia bacterium]
MKRYLILLILNLFFILIFVFIYGCSTSTPTSTPNPPSSSSIPVSSTPVPANIDTNDTKDTMDTTDTKNTFNRMFGSDQHKIVLNNFVRNAFADTVAIDVAYVTNRKMLNNSSSLACSNNSFSVEASNASSLAYGICRVNVPKLHRVGNFEITSNPRANPHQYFRVIKHNPLTENLLQSYLLQLQEQHPSDILVFVHGFNVKFEEAVIRTAQIAYDLKYQGPVILFSWPAGASSGVFESAMINKTYENNLKSAVHSVPHFTYFMKKLANIGIKVHLIIHSMGHQLAIPALAQLVLSNQGISNSNLENKKFIGELILNAPDIPVNDFERLLPSLKKIAERITVYCSYNDNAIAVSEIYNKNRRMGGCEKLDGIDSINVGEIDAPTLGIGGLGHGLYSSRSILTDIFQLLLGIDAEKRLFIRKSEPNSTEDFYLRP